MLTFDYGGRGFRPVIKFLLFFYNLRIFATAKVINVRKKIYICEYFLRQDR